MAQRGRKPKEKKGYFEEPEELAVHEYNRIGKIISGCTTEILKIRFNCTDEDLEIICSGRTLYDVLNMSEQIEITDESKRKRVDELSSIVNKSVSERDALFDAVLKPAFKKMVESIIRTYKLYVPDEDFDATFNDTMSYLTTKISNFKKPKGTKAFSYCGTICKNYLLFKKMQYDKNLKRSVPYEMIREGISDNLNYSDIREDRDSYVRSEKLLMMITSEIQKMIANREDYKLSDGEVAVGSAIIELVNNWETILKATEDDTNEETECVNPMSPYKSISNKLQKSKILYFLREETMMSTKEVRDNMRKYKVVYVALKKMMQEQ